METQTTALRDDQVMRTRMLAGDGLGGSTYREGLTSLAVYFEHLSHTSGRPLDIVIEDWSKELRPNLSTSGRGIHVRHYLKVLYPVASDELLRARRVRVRRECNRRNYLTRIGVA